MARKRHSDEDILKLLREIELKLAAGADVVSAGQGHMMGQGYMMGPGYMMAPDFNQRGNVGPGMMQTLREDLSIGDVRHMMEHRLRWMNNPNLKLGNVEEKDTDTITADIITKDGSLVQRLNVDRHTGWMQPSQ